VAGVVGDGVLDVPPRRNEIPLPVGTTAPGRPPRDYRQPEWGNAPDLTPRRNNIPLPVGTTAPGRPPHDYRQPEWGNVPDLPPAGVFSPPERLSVGDSGPGDYDQSPPQHFRVIGEAMKTYIIVEYRNSVWFIDKHAAHERIHFDALRAANYEPMPQLLITPVVCRLGQDDAATLLENTALLETLGFNAESFGDDSVAVRQIPSEIDISDVEPVLSEICAQLNLGAAPEPSQRDNILRSIACKAAIKAGKSSEKKELETLTARVLSGEIAQCPHGRPVAFEIKKTTLERNFKRI